MSDQTEVHIKEWSVKVKKTLDEIIDYQGPLYAKHPDLNLPPVPPLDKYGQANPRPTDKDS